MKKISILLFCSVVAVGCENPTVFCYPKQSFSPNEVNSISTAIYRIEGGSKTKYPFGIKSINTNGDYNKAKRICENTIINNHKRWLNRTNKQECYLNFLANKYCPTSADKQGNINWKKNIHSVLNK